MCVRHTALMSVVNALGARNRPSKRTAVHDDDRVWVEAELKDVGDQALMRGLATAFPIVRPGLFRSYCGRRSNAGHKASDGCSPAVVPPPPMREVQVRCAIYDLIDCASLATAHMKPLSSRAMAVQTTVVRFPRPVNVR